jgi:hypothetical protein
MTLHGCKPSYIERSYCAWVETMCVSGFLPPSDISADPTVTNAAGNDLLKDLADPSPGAQTFYRVRAQ